MPDLLEAVGVITEPGVYDLPAETYHADPIPGGSLSSSGARRLLPPSCPALFRHEQLHGRKPRRVFEIGHAAHALVLGTGPELVRVEADSWRTNAAKDAAAEARERGAVPLLPDEYAEVHAMAAALRAHPVASALFDPDYGRAEQALVWRDGPSGIWRRAMLDWLPDPGSGRLIVPDYKTTVCAAPSELSKAVHKYGYHQQHAWYVDGAQALDLGDQDAAFVFVFQEKTAPYLVTVIELDALALRIGRDLNRQAIEIYARCSESGVWPGYSDDVESVPLPAWVERAYENGDLL
jgi:hypothetical protein